MNRNQWNSKQIEKKSMKTKAKNKSWKDSKKLQMWRQTKTHKQKTLNM